MWFKNLFHRPRKAITLDDQETDQLLTWSLDAARRNESALPDWCKSHMQLIVAWYAVPAMVALRYKKATSPVPDRLLDALERAIGQAVMVALFAEQAEDEELQEIREALFPVTRKLIVFWLVAFESLNARRYFQDHGTLKIILSLVIENPQYGLEEMFGTDEEDRPELADAFATNIVQSYRQIDRLANDWD